MLTVLDAPVAAQRTTGYDARPVNALPVIDWHPRLTRSRERLVLWALALRAGSDGWAQPSLDELAADTGMHRDSVRLALRSLVALGVVDRRPVPGRPAQYRPPMVDEPNRWMILVRALPAEVTRNARERLVLWVLARRANKAGRSWASVGLIAWEAGFDVRSCRRVIAGLVARGLVTRQERHRSDGSRASNLWCLDPARFTPWEGCGGVSRGPGGRASVHPLGGVRGGEPGPGGEVSGGPPMNLQMNREGTRGAFEDEHQPGLTFDGKRRVTMTDSLFSVPAQPASKQRRDRDELWDAIVTAAGLDPTALTATTRSMVGKVRRELAEVGATPELVDECARWLRAERRWRDVRVHQLSSEWAAFSAWRNATRPGPRPGQRPSDEDLERAMFPGVLPARPADTETVQLSRLVLWDATYGPSGKPDQAWYFEHSGGWVRDVVFDADTLRPWEGLPDWTPVHVGEWRWNTVLDVARVIAGRDTRPLVSAEHDERMRQAGITW